MADGRRTRWVAHDVYFLDEGLGEAMFDRFGGAGVALWHGFIAACKKNHIEGETSWSSTPEALTTLGLPGMALLDNDGVPFDLDEWLKLLSDHKVIRRTSRGRRVKVACTKWGRWQQAARRSRKAAAQAESRDDAGQHNRRSEQENTGTVSARKEHDTGALGAQMTDTDTDTDTDKERGSRRRAHQLPDGWSPDEETLVKQRKEFPNVNLDRELQRFRNHWQSKGETRKDWLATWRNWVLKADEWAAPVKPSIEDSWDGVQSGRLDLSEVG